MLYDLLTVWNITLSQKKQYTYCKLNMALSPVTHLGIGQIGHGLGPRVTPSCDDLFKIEFAKVWRHKFTIYFETIQNANV